MKTKFLCFVFIICCFNIFAQQTDDDKWTLKECIDYALSKNLSVQRSVLNAENFEIDRDQAQFSRLPNVNGGANYGYSWGRGLDPVSNSFTTQEIQSSGLSANASVPIFNAFRIYHSIKQTQNNYEAAEQDLAKAKNDVILSVAGLFINVVFNKELVENARFQLTSSQQQLERTRKQVAAGALPKSDELNLEAQVATNEVSVVQQENALAVSILQLKQALLIPAEQSFDVEIPSIAPDDLIINQSRDQIYEVARKSMPEIRSAELKIEGAKYAVRAQRANLYPRLSLVGGLNTNYSSAQNRQFHADSTFSPSNRVVGFVNNDINSPVFGLQPNGTFTDYGFNEQIKDNVYRTLGFQLSIPIFNGFSTRANIKRSRIQSRMAELNAVEVDQILRQNVETAYNNALAASKSYNAFLRQVQAREEAFRMMEKRFDAGSANSFEYQVSQNDLFRARSDLSRAKYDFIFRKKVLDFYQGIPLEY